MGIVIIKCPDSGVAVSPCTETAQSGFNRSPASSVLHALPGLPNQSLVWFAGQLAEAANRRIIL